MSHVILNERLQPFTALFYISIQVVYLQRYLVVAWLVPREIAAVSAHVLCTQYNHAPIYRVTLFEATCVGACVLSCNLPPALLAE